MSCFPGNGGHGLGPVKIGMECGIWSPGSLRDVHEEVHVNRVVPGVTTHAPNGFFVLRGVNKEVQVGSELARFADHAPDGLIWINHLCSHGPWLPGLVRDVHEDAEIHSPPVVLADCGSHRSGWRGWWFHLRVVRNVQEEIHGHIEVPGLPHHAPDRYSPVYLLDNYLTVSPGVVWNVHEEVEGDAVAPGFSDHAPQGSPLVVLRRSVELVMLVQSLPHGRQVGLQKVNFILKMCDVLLIVMFQRVSPAGVDKCRQQ
mmetsp:Transcript_1865/g.3189  ORF Transcript_1865/g.3189 Transcript_1865/m.3189 type:complete len:257 (+) Transcript_1865:134-904(+)